MEFEMYVRPTLGAKEAYVPGLTQDYVAKKYGIPHDDVAKLGSAENPYGPSPKAAEAVKLAAKIDNYASAAIGGCLVFS